jgi:TonB-linked SusC/RagA family outer membrane protein
MKHHCYVLKCALFSLLSLIFMHAGFAQDTKTWIRGLIENEKGEPVEAVSVQLKHQSAQLTTATNEKGIFTFEKATEDGAYQITISHIGYITQTLNRNNLDAQKQEAIYVVLQSSKNSLNEVVVVGYGSVKKRDLTGSVSTIKTKDVQTMPVGSIDKALQGQAAGLQLTQTSGSPGASTIIRIRGGNSINGGNEPLFVIDGIPVSSGSGGLDAGALRSSSVNALTLINPNDIGSIEILKDASATAIYGSRGANGVILISTKRGKGKGVFNLDTYYGWQQPRDIPQMMNASQYAKAVNDYNIATGKTPEYTPSAIDSLGEGTNWIKQITRNAPIQNYQLSLRGSDETLKYSVSGNYYNQQGIIQNSGLKRYSLNLNLEKKVNSKLTLNNSSLLSYVQNNGVVSEGGYSNTGVSSVIFTALQYDPTAPVRNTDGNYNFSPRMESSRLSNPVAIVNDITNQSKVIRILENLSAEYFLSDGLSLKVAGGADFMTSKEQFYEGRSVIEGRDNNGVANLGSVQNYSFLNENTLNYTHRFGSDHLLNVLAGITAQTNRTELMTASSKGFTNDNLGVGNLGAGSGVLPPTSNIVEWALLSYLGRVNYSYRDKYLFTATARYDGSSRFGADRKYGFFPSFAVAWRMSEEDFIKNITAISDLKIRLSYGLTGNQAVSPYSAIQLLAVSRAIIGQNVQVGLAPSNIANPQLGWEQTAQLDIGADLNLFKDRISVTADFYRKITSNLLLNVTLPYSTGFSSSLQNMGKLRNQGFEFSLNTVNTTGAFNWTTNLNFSFNKNTLLSMGTNNEYFVSLNEGNGYGNILVQPGQPIGNFYGYVTDGIFQNDAEVAKGAQPGAVPGDRRFKDISGPDGKPDGVITDKDRTIVGNSQPKMIFGFSNSFSWKGIECSFTIQGVQGNSIYNSQKTYYENFVPNNNSSVAVLNAWTPGNTSTNIPRIGTGEMSMPYQLSDYFVEDGSYVRLKNITLGYNVPSRMLNSKFISVARIYFSAQDLITLTNYSGFDPEVSRFAQNNLTQGVDLGGYPRARTFTVGLSLGF